MDAIIEMALNCLTEKQRRRYILYLHGASLTEIARKESISIVTAFESIKLAKRKIKKRLAHLKNT